jgi:outer membrane receptor protein involved in Fe transport
MGAIFAITKGIHVFASYSEMVTFTNQMSYIGPGVVPADNPHLLDNENDKGTEIGIKTDWKDNTLSGTLSMYSDERSGYVQLDFAKSINDPRNQGSNITTTQAQPYINGGVQKAEGLEADLTWTPNRNWQMTVNGAWQYTAEQVSDSTLDPRYPGDLQHQTFHRRLIKSPKYRANIMGKYNFTGDFMHGVSIGGAMRYTDWYYVTASPQYWIIVPHEVIFDAFAMYSTKTFGTPTDYQLNVMNLTNQINDITRSNGLEIRGSVGFRF